MAREVERVCRAQCAYCGADELDYTETVFNGDEVYFNFQCTKCGNFGSEAYKLEYISTVVEIDEK